MLVSYINKKKSGKKNVIVLSTMHENVKVAREKRGSWCCWFVVNESFYKNKNKNSWDQMQRPSLGTMASSLTTSNYIHTLQIFNTTFNWATMLRSKLITNRNYQQDATFPWYQRSFAETRCDVSLISKKFRGNLKFRMLKQVWLEHVQNRTRRFEQ